MNPFSTLRRALVRRSFRRAGAQFTNVLRLNLPGLAETRGVCALWCVELPVRIVEIAFTGSSSGLLNQAILSVRKGEHGDFFKSSSLCCLGLLLSISRTMPGVSRDHAERFVRDTVSLYGPKPSPDPFTVDPLLNLTPPTEWFATTLWLNMFLRTSGHAVLAKAMTGGLDHIEQFQLRVLDSILLELVTRVAQELLINRQMLENYVEAAQRDGITRPPKEHVTAYDALLESGGRAIIEGCKSRIKEPIKNTSDERILSIYRQVGSAFRKVSEERAETLSAGVIIRIVLQFVVIHEQYGEEFFVDHIRYETQKFKNEGLRDDYRTEVHFV